MADPDEQVDEVIRILREVLGEKVEGAYLHGSAAIGGMQATSDIDVLAVVREATTVEERRAIVTRTMAVSGSPEPRGRWRPVELSIVVQSAVNPWRYAPTRELQYGEWERRRYETGWVPEPEPDPDLAVLITQVLRADRPLLGPRPAAILAPVPLPDLRRSIVAGVPGLVADLELDTRNVLLTLVRVWSTLATGEIRSKADAVDWALEHHPASGEGAASLGATLALAREQYLAGTHGEDAWARETLAARAAAEAMVAEIDRLRSATP